MTTKSYTETNEPDTTLTDKSTKPSKKRKTKHVEAEKPDGDKEGYQNMSVQTCFIEPIEVWLRSTIQFTGRASKSAVMTLSPIRNKIEMSFHFSILVRSANFVSDWTG